MFHDGPTGWGARLEAEFTPGLVSVIIPTYNRAALLLEAIESLRQQTWRALEIVVVDDGSTDDTQCVLETLAEWGDGRTFLKLRQPNQGSAAARNCGTCASTGEFIVYLDSDDILVADAIEHYVEAIRDSGSDYCHGSIDSMDGTGNTQPDNGIWHSRPQTPGDLLINMWLVHAACYRRSLLQQVGPWNEAMDRAEDYEFLLRIKTSGKGVRLTRVQGFYRMHAVDQRHRLDEFTGIYRPILTMLESFTTWLEKRGPIPPSVRMLLSERYRFIAVREASAGDMRTKNRALDDMGKLLKGSWSPLRLYLLLRWVNFPGFYGGLANFKQRLKGRKSGVLASL